MSLARFLYSGGLDGDHVIDELPAVEHRSTAHRYTDISFIFIATLSLISVSYQAGPIEELVQYKKIVLYEEENSAFAGMVYTLYFRHLLIPGLPADISRPAIFIAVGQPSFTALAFIGMAKDVTATKIFSTYITLTGVEDQTIIPDGLQLLALIAAVFLWVLAFWFLSIALVATIEAVGRNSFHLNWYAYIFPNVEFTITTIKI